MTAWRQLRLEHFTFVMATGIVSTALHNSLVVWPAGTVPGEIARLLSVVLFGLALAGYVVLFTGVLAGLAAGITTPRGELAGRSVRTLAVVAAGGVLAARMTPLGWHGLALALIAVSAAAWLVLQYGVLGALVVRAGATRGGRSLRLFDGTWFLVVVSTQALAVSLGAWSKATGADLAATFAVLFWGLGVLQLILVAALVSARLLLAGVKPGDEVAPYWVFLGAGAISILGAAEVLGTREEQIVMPPMLVGGVAMALWAFVTWMIPPTVALQVWQRGRAGAIRCAGRAGSTSWGPGRRGSPSPSGWRSSPACRRRPCGGSDGGVPGRGHGRDLARRPEFSTLERLPG